MRVHHPFPSSRRSLLRAPAPLRAAAAARAVLTARDGGAVAASVLDGARHAGERPAIDAATPRRGHR